MDGNLEKYLRIIIFIIALGLIGFGAFLSFEEKNTGAGLTYTAGILCLIFSFITSFKSFKGLGIKAELQNKLDEADRIIKYLKEIAEPISEIALSSLSRIGFMRGPILRSEQYQLKNNIEKALKQIGLDDKRIYHIARDWHQFNLLVLTNPLVDRIKSELNNIQQSKTKQLEQFKSPISSDDKLEFDKIFKERQRVESEIELLKKVRLNIDIEDPDQHMLRFLSECETLSDQIKERIKRESSDTLEDLRYYKKNRDFRRPEQWFENDDWKK